MKITSQQKKFGLPLAGFLISFIAYLIALGSFWAIVLVGRDYGCVPRLQRQPHHREH